MDADREGEMIARELLELANFRGKIQRCWLTALDPENIRKALTNSQKIIKKTESLPVITHHYNINIKITIFRIIF